MKQAVISIVPTTADAERIIVTLRDAGFGNADISLLMPDQGNLRDIGVDQTSKAPEGATAGASTGAILGGALGWLAGIGSLAIPGIGPFVAAGPIMAALSGAAIGAATGGMTGALIGLGLPEFEAKQYEGKLREGNILISVHTENGDEAKEVEEIFKSAGAKDIKRTGELKVR